MRRRRSCGYRKKRTTIALFIEGTKPQASDKSNTSPGGLNLNNQGGDGANDRSGQRIGARRAFKVAPAGKKTFNRSRSLIKNTSAGTLVLGIACDM